jgi:hypothetical protein
MTAPSSQPRGKSQKPDFFGLDSPITELLIYPIAETFNFIGQNLFIYPKLRLFVYTS